MKKTLKTALASTLAVCLTCSALAFGSSAAAPDRTAADTDTAYAVLTKDGNIGDVSSKIGEDWIKTGMTLSVDAKMTTDKYDFSITFNSEKIKFQLWGARQVLFKYNNKDVYWFDADKLNKAEYFNGSFNFEDWHNYKVKFVSDGTKITEIVITVDGQILKSNPQTDVLNYINAIPITYATVKSSNVTGTKDGEWFLDNVNVTYGKTVVLAEDFEEGTEEFKRFTQQKKVGNGIMGDLDQSGSVDILDLVKLKKLSVSTEQVVITEGTNALADVEDDSVINAQDVVALRKILISM